MVHRFKEILPNTRKKNNWIVLINYLNVPVNVTLTIRNVRKSVLRSIKNVISLGKMK